MRAMIQDQVCRAAILAAVVNGLAGKMPALQNSFKAVVR
jgi:hypothetical protein